MLRLENIVKNYLVAGKEVKALKGISLNFRKSEFVSILGPSGCGKTTMLNIIGGLDKYTSGDLIINGRSTKVFNDKDWDVYRNHRIGFVFQSYNLIPHQTVLGNVELALTIAGISKQERKQRAKEALIKVGLGDQLNKKPNQLSGGQCQRVAIARALVNNPEILLADEPTGALDSVTSVQIMNLMKEIAGERLVIMVTHNPELAEQYSTRIVSLRDGEVVSDTNPFSTEDEIEENRVAAELEKAKAEAELKEEQAEQTTKKKKKKENSKEKAKMGLGTAFALSGRNLLAKRGRTIAVGIAGSIGIIGIAIVLAFSSGIQGYINSMQNDMLSGYPLFVAKNSVDYTQLMNLTMNMMEDEDKSWYEDNKVYVNSVVQTLIELGGSNITNNITKEYVDYVGDMPSEYYETIQYDYGINLSHNIYTSFSYDEEGAVDSQNNPIEDETLSLSTIKNIYADILSTVDDYSAYASMVGSVSSIGELPDSKEYILTQYDIVAGEYPEQSDKNKLVLVINSDNEVTDLVLGQFGYVSSREFLNYAYRIAENELYDPDVPSMNTPYDYSEFVGENAKKFYWYPNSAAFDYVGSSSGTDQYKYNSSCDDFTAEEKAEAIELSVACVLKPKSNVQYGSLQMGMYYTQSLVDYVRSIETNPDTQSEIVKRIIASNSGEDAKEESELYATNITTSYKFYYDERNKETGEITRNILGDMTDEGYGTNTSSASGAGMGAITSIMDKEEFIQMIKLILAQQGGTAEEQLNALILMFAEAIYNSSDKVVYLSELGGCEIPEKITFYVDNFKDKDLVTAYLDEWNVGKEEVEQIKYTDTVGAIMTMVNTLITMITTALIAFTSISLVVSTVMIGIITFVSVMERVKEIGVIRAMGGSKRDVKNLFMAETFIIGFLAGLIGVIVTYLLSLVANLIIGSIVGIYTIASLPIWQAAIMVAISVLLTLISGLLPASKAAKQDPVNALRAE